MSYICKSLRMAMLKHLYEKLKIMKANGSNCADVLAKIKKWEELNK